MDTPGERFDWPRTRRTTVAQPSRCTSVAVWLAHSPKVVSAAEISSTFRLLLGLEELIVPCGAVRQGGAVRSQGDSASVPVGAAVSPWRPRQVWPLPAAGAARCSRQKLRSRVRSAEDAKGRCVARRPQDGKHPLRSHHATQNSCPASLAGGRCSRSTGRVPPGRTTMLLNSASGDGLSTRATEVLGVLSAVREDMPLRVDACEVETVVGAMLGTELALPWGRVGARYSSGIGTQWLEK